VAQVLQVLQQALAVLVEIPHLAPLLAQAAVVAVAVDRRQRMLVQTVVLAGEALLLLLRGLAILQAHRLHRAQMEELD
jgi:hypothetical protein